LNVRDKQQIPLLEDENPALLAALRLISQRTQSVQDGETDHPFFGSSFNINGSISEARL
jgi:hypothetical protein